MTALRFIAAEASHELRAGCRGPLIPIVFPGLMAYLVLVLLNADYMRDMGATDVPRNSPHLVYLMVSGQAVWLLFVWAWVFPFTVRKVEGRGDPPGRSVRWGRGGWGAAGCRVHLQMPVDADVVRSNLVAEALDGGGEPLFDGGKIILGGDTSHAAEQQYEQGDNTDCKGGISVPTPVPHGARLLTATLPAACVECNTCGLGGSSVNIPFTAKRPRSAADHADPTVSIGGSERRH